MSAQRPVHGSSRMGPRSGAVKTRKGVSLDDVSSNRGVGTKATATKLGGTSQRPMRSYSDDDNIKIAKKSMNLGKTSKMEQQVVHLCGVLEANPGELWDRRVKALRELRDLFNAQAEKSDSNELDVTWTKNMWDVMLKPFETQLLDLRSGITKEIGDTLLALVSAARDEASPLLLLLLPSIFQTLNSGNNIIFGHIDESMRKVLPKARIKKGVPTFLKQIESTRSNRLKRVLVEYMGIILATWGRAFLKKDAEIIGKMLEKMLKDQSAEVRSAARGTFAEFNALFPTQAKEVFSHLDGRIRSAVKEALLEREDEASAPSTTAELKGALTLAEKVNQLWNDMPKDKKSAVNRLKCWDILLADAQLASLIGQSDPAKGVAILRAMKDVRALDTSGDGKITKEEFKRLNDPEVLAAAQTRVALIEKVERMWGSMRKGKDGKIERVECWSVLLKDVELATLLGESHADKGLEIMHAMKAAHALDYSKDGFITVDEFRRLYNPEVISSAKSRASLISYVHEMWAIIPKDDIIEGRVERLACWDFILSDYEIANLIGNLNPSKGKAMLTAMKEVRALDILGDGYIIEAGFYRLYNPIAIQSAEVRVALPFIVDNLWNSIAKDETEEINRVECWEIVFSHEELASTIGSGDVAEGMACLNAMKELNLGHANHVGNVNSEEFRRFCDPRLIAAACTTAAVPFHLANVWKQLPKDNKGRVDRVKTWDFLFADKVLNSRIGNGDIVKGQRMLEIVRVTSEESREKKMIEVEFMLLFEESRLAAAEATVMEPLKRKVGKLWENFQKGRRGRVQQSGIWESILADEELATIVGQSDIPRGLEILRAMRSAWILVKSPGENVTVEDFQRLFNSSTYAAAGRSIGLASMVAEIWTTIPKSVDGRTQWLMCWDTIQANNEFVALLGNSNVFRGTALLASTKELMAANAPPDWAISQDEFQCLAEPAILAAAEYRVSLIFKVDLMWKELSAADNSKFERSQCWHAILADDELAALVGVGDVESGRGVLGAIKNTKALEDFKTGREWISEVEFRRLYDPYVLLNARRGGSAATNIQARARGVQARQKHVRKQSAAVKIEATARGRAGRKYVRRRNDSAVKLQARTRGNAVRAGTTRWADDYLATKVYRAGELSEAVELSTSVAISRAVEVHLARLTRDPSTLAALVQQVPPNFQRFLEGDDFLVRCDLKFDALLQQEPTYKAGETEQDDTAGIPFEAMLPVLNELARDLGKREPAASAVSSWVAPEGGASGGAALASPSASAEGTKLTPTTLLRVLEVFDYDRKASVDRFEFSDCAKFFSALSALGTGVAAASYGREENMDANSSSSGSQEQVAKDALAFARSISAEPFGLLGGPDPMEVGSCCITDCTAAELVDTDGAVPHVQPGNSPALSSAAMGPATTSSSSSSSNGVNDQQAQRRAAVYAWLGVEVPATEFPPMVAPKLTRAGDACHRRYLKGLLTQGTALSVHVVHAKGPNLSSAISNSKAATAGVAAATDSATPSNSGSCSSGTKAGYLDISGFAPAPAAGLVWERMRQLAAERGGLTQMMKLFQELDTDGSGAINVDEFGVFLEREIRVQGCSPELVAAVVAVADTDGDGSVNYSEMLSVLGSKRINVHGLSPAAGGGLICGRLRQVAAERGGLVKILQLFQELDRDQSGSITTDEFKAFLEALHIAGADAATAAAVVAAADIDGDGAVDYEEFLKMLGTPLCAAAAKPKFATGGSGLFEESDGLSGFVEPLDLSTFSTAAAAGMVWARLRQLAAMEGGAAKVRYFFEELDVDGSGTATAAEFGVILERLELYGASPEVLAAVVEAGDSSGDGSVDYSELVDMLGLPVLNVTLVDHPEAAAGLVWGMLRQVAAERGGKSMILAMFQEMDTDGSGDLEVSEFEAFLAKLNVVGCSQACLEAVVSVADVDGDGTVNCEEFLRALGHSGGAAVQPKAPQSSSSSSSTLWSRGEVLAELAACYRNILGAFLNSDCHTLRLAPIELPLAITNRSKNSSSSSGTSVWDESSCQSLVEEWPRLTLEALRLGYAQLAPRDRAALYASGGNDANRSSKSNINHNRLGGVGILNGSILVTSARADRHTSSSNSGSSGRQVDLCLVDPSQTEVYRTAGFAESRGAVAARQASLEKEKQARKQAAKATATKAKADEKARIAAEKAEKKASAKELKAKAAAAKKGNASVGAATSSGAGGSSTDGNRAMAVGNVGGDQSVEKTTGGALTSSSDARPATRSGGTMSGNSGNSNSSNSSAGWFSGRLRRISGENSDTSNRNNSGSGGTGSSGGGSGNGNGGGSLRSGSHGEGGWLVSPEAVAASRASRYAALVELRRSCGLGEELEESLSSSNSSSSSSSASSSTTSSSGKTSNSASTFSSLHGAPSSVPSSSSSSRHPLQQQHAASLVPHDMSSSNGTTSNAPFPVNIAAAAPLSSQDMHVRVVCRVRPENTLERGRSGGGAVKILSSNEVEVLAPVDSQSSNGSGGGGGDAPTVVKKDTKAGTVGGTDGSKPHRDGKASKSKGRRNASFTEGTSFAPVAAASGGIAANAPALGQRQAHRFTFDRVLGPSSTQQECYEAAAAPVISTFLTGYNCTIFAYGQTASGKTHTMEGPSIVDPTNRGVIPRAAADIFSHVHAVRSAAGSGSGGGSGSAEGAGAVNLSVRVSVSYIEIYLERVRDLLDASGARNNLQVREDPKSGVFVDGCTAEACATEADLVRVFTVGASGRAKAATLMNEGSSRSHSVFMVTLSSANSHGSTRTGKLFLVDLAGSEMVRKTSATGRQLDEAKTINKSLSALGLVIAALGEEASAKTSAHVPYRDSKLTRVLQDSLGGNAMTSLLVNCSPSAYNAAETLSTLRFGNRAKAIKNRPQLNEEQSPLELRALLARAQAELSKQRKYMLSLEGAVLEGPVATNILLGSSLGSNYSTYSGSSNSMPLMHDSRTPTKGGGGAQSSARKEANNSNNFSVMKYLRSSSNVTEDLRTSRDAAQPLSRREVRSLAHVKYCDALLHLQQDSEMESIAGLPRQPFKNLLRELLREVRAGPSPATSTTTDSSSPASASDKALASDADLDEAFRLATGHENGVVDEAAFVALVEMVRRGDVAGLGKTSMFGFQSTRKHKRVANFQHQLRGESTSP